MVTRAVLTLFPVVGWTGFVLIGLAILTALLDWGELSGLDEEAPKRRPTARFLAVCGAVLLVVGVLGSILG